MAVRDEDFESGLTLVEGDDGIWSSPEAAPASSPRDWRSEYEREHARAERERARADAAEARCEELRWAEVDSRARAGSLKWQLDRSRSKLKAAVEETQEVRRTAKDALSLQAEVTRLEKLLSEARIEPAKHRPTSPADKARRRLRATLERAENQKATIKSLRAERGELRKEVTRLNREVTRLGKWLAREEQASERHKETIRRQYDEDIRLRAALRRLRDQSDRVRSLSEEIFWLRIALDGAKAGKETLKARLVKLRAVGATLSKLPSDEAAHLRAALRRSRRQKTTINVLSKENARLRRAVKGARTRREASDAQLAKLRATGKSLSKSLSGVDAELRRTLMCRAIPSAIRPTRTRATTRTRVRDTWRRSSKPIVKMTVTRRLPRHRTSSPHVEVHKMTVHDGHRLADALDDLSERALRPAVMLGDSHYGSSDNMALTREQNINLVAPARPPKGAVSGRLTLEDFTLNEEGLVLRCPNNVEPVSASLAKAKLQGPFRPFHLPKMSRYTAMSRAGGQA